MGMDKFSSNEDGKSEYLYQPEILQRLDFNKSPAVFKPKISAAQPGEDWMIVRPLQRSDYDKGFLHLLGQLTSVGNVSKKQFDERFTQMKHSGGYYVTVIEDTRISKIIGAATLTIEQKFIHNCSLRGRLEDVVVNDTYRGKQLGKLIVVTVSLLAQELGCYKMSLDCKDKLIKFYETLGYKMEPGNSNAMNMSYQSYMDFPIGVNYTGVNNRRVCHLRGIAETVQLDYIPSFGVNPSWLFQRREFDHIAEIIVASVPDSMIHLDN